MKTGAKIAIGCVVTVVVLVVVGAVGMVASFYWAKNKVKAGIESIQGDQNQINAYLKEARAHPFTQPTDGVITEPQLLKFLEVRKKIFGVYRKYGQQLEALDKQKSQGQGPGLAGLTTLVSGFNEIRLSQAQALAETGMNPQEYMYLVGAVYKTYYANMIAKQNGGKQLSEVVGDMSKTIENATPPPAPANDTPEAAQARAQAAQQLEQLKGQFQQLHLQEQAKAAEVPQANLDLFRKYETEINKYVMPGLEAADLIEMGLTAPQ
jgi:hypothetical protein